MCPFHLSLNVYLCLDWQHGRMFKWTHVCFSVYLQLSDPPECHFSSPVSWFNRVDVSHVSPSVACQCSSPHSLITLAAPTVNFLASSDAPVDEQVDDLLPLRSAAHHLWTTQVQPSSRWTTITTQDHTGCHLLSADETEAATVNHICCHCS